MSSIVFNASSDSTKKYGSSVFVKLNLQNGKSDKTNKLFLSFMTKHNNRIMLKKKITHLTRPVCVDTNSKAKNCGSPPSYPG